MWNYLCCFVWCCGSFNLFSFLFWCCLFRLYIFLMHSLLLSTFIGLLTDLKAFWDSGGHPKGTVLGGCYDKYCMCLSIAYIYTVAYVHRFIFLYQILTQNICIVTEVVHISSTSSLMFSLIEKLCRSWRPLCRIRISFWSDINESHPWSGWECQKTEETTQHIQICLCDRIWCNPLNYDFLWIPRHNKTLFNVSWNDSQPCTKGLTHPTYQKTLLNVTLESKEVSIEVANILTVAMTTCICSEGKNLWNRQLYKDLPESQLEKCSDYTKISRAKEAGEGDSQMQLNVHLDQW